MIIFSCFHCFSWKATFFRRTVFITFNLEESCLSELFAVLKLIQENEEKVTKTIMANKAKQRRHWRVNIYEIFTLYWCVGQPLEILLITMILLSWFIQVYFFLFLFFCVTRRLNNIVKWKFEYFIMTTILIPILYYIGVCDSHYY